MSLSATVTQRQSLCKVVFISQLCLRLPLLMAIQLPAHGSSSESAGKRERESEGRDGRARPVHRTHNASVYSPFLTHHICLFVATVTDCVCLFISCFLFIHNLFLFFASVQMNVRTFLRFLLLLVAVRCARGAYKIILVFCQKDIL